MPVPMDEYPLHQAPVTLSYVGTSDRNFYDRCYFNGHDRSGDIFFVSGLGFYPNLGVKDAYAAVRRGNTQRVIRCSDEIDDNRLSPSVGPYRIEVREPLQQVRIVCEGAPSSDGGQGISFDLTWDGSYPAIDEERHQLRSGARLILDTWRFAQVGTWSGVLRVDGDEIQVSPDTWVGTRDRSWGIRPVGEAEPAGRPGASDFGFWWLYVPIRFESFAVVVIAQEDGAGHRTLNDAVRVWKDGSVEQLGWPRVQIDYKPGTRHPEHARIHLTERDGSPFVLEVEPGVGDSSRGYVPLHLGCGYGGDSDWQHGVWRGAGWVDSASYDLTDPATLGRVQWGVVDHVARATVNDEIGWGLFEHGTIGRHVPSGFADLMSVAP